MILDLPLTSLLIFYFLTVCYASIFLSVYLSHTQIHTRTHILFALYLARPSHKSHLQILVAGVARAVELLAEPSFIIQNNCQKDLTTFRYSSRERKKNLVRYRISKTEIIFSDNSNKKNSNCRKKVFFPAKFRSQLSDKPFNRQLNIEQLLEI